MEKIYLVRYRSPRFNDWKEVTTDTFDRALRFAKVASGDLVGGWMVSIFHIPTGKVICYCANGMVA